MNPEYLQELKKGYVRNNLRRLAIEALRKNGGKSHPYAIETFIRKECGTAPAQSNLRNELRRMERDGIVESRNETANGKLKRIYTLYQVPEEQVLDEHQSMF